jgi:hypothetical protein
MYVLFHMHLITDNAILAHILTFLIIVHILQKFTQNSFTVYNKDTNLLNYYLLLCYEVFLLLHNYVHSHPTKNILHYSYFCNNYHHILYVQFLLSHHIQMLLSLILKDHLHGSMKYWQIVVSSILQYQFHQCHVYPKKSLQQSSDPYSMYWP